MVLGPLEGLSEKTRARKLIVHNPNLTLVRLTPGELKRVGEIVAGKLNRAQAAVRIYIPLQGFSFPDREGLPHWEPEGNRQFIDALKDNLNDSIMFTEVDAHVNDPEFMDVVVEAFFKMMGAG